MDVTDFWVFLHRVAIAIDGRYRLLGFLYRVAIAIGGRYRLLGFIFKKKKMLTFAVIDLVGVLVD